VGVTSVYGQYDAKDLGPFPVDVINDALGTELDAGNARLSRTAHRHIAEDHPADYAVCMAHMAAVIAAPTYIGQAPRHGSYFEMIKRVSVGKEAAVLVAIGLEPDERGAYRIVSSYLLGAEEIERKRAAGYLRFVRAGKTKGPA